MKIECKLKREGGTHVDLGKTKYHFAPLADGAHVALVEDEAHQDRFLSIPEAYRLYRGELAAAPISAPGPAKANGTTVIGPAPLPEQPTAQPDAEQFQGVDGYQASYEFGSVGYSIEAIIVKAAKANGLSPKDWNDLSEDGRAGLIDDVLDALAADTNGDGVVDSAEERAALAQQYEAKFGKKPHHNLGVAKLRAALAE